MPEETNNTPSTPAEPSIAELRTMLASEETPAAEPAAETTETSVAAGDEKTVEGKPEAKSASEAAVEKPEEKHESAIDKRFRKLASQRDEARQRAEKAERELAAKSTPPGPAAQPVTEAQPATATTKPAPPDPSKWTGTWEELEKEKLDYVEKLTDWKAGERERAQQTRERQAQAQTLHKTWEQKSEAFGKDNADFEDAIQNIGPKVTQAGVADLIKESPVGPEMVLYLHQHPEEAARMGQCKTQVSLARELGKLEAQLSAPVSNTTTPAAKARLPKPPTSVGAGQPATVDLEKCDMRSFRREVGKLCSRD